MKAVHLGAGNIGRGFIGLLLAEAGYDLTMVDINSQLVDQIKAEGHWRVTEVGPGGQHHRVDRVSALDLVKEEGAVITALAQADVITTALGASVLPAIAPLLANGLNQRDPNSPPVLVMACENAIRATDILKEAVAATDPTVMTNAIWANTAVDRIVPNQGAEAGLDVQVEPYCEWVIELPAHQRPAIPGATFVDHLDPFIARKLYTVNTGHCAIAWLGQCAGYHTIHDALADETIAEQVRQILGETTALLLATYPDLNAGDQAAYCEKVLSRFTNPALTDTVERVGRSPLRKLSRHERFIGPIADCAQQGLPTDGLLNGVLAGLAFHAEGDVEVASLQRMLQSLEPSTLVQQVMDVHPGMAAYDRLVDALTNRR